MCRLIMETGRRMPTKMVKPARRILCGHRTDPKKIRSLCMEGGKAEPPGPWTGAAFSALNLIFFNLLDASEWNTHST
jgi:hypothetical protein